MNTVKTTLAVFATAAALGVSSFAHAGATLDAVQKKGFVQCGISDGLPGFSYPTKRVTILAWTSMSAVRSPLRCLAMQAKYATAL
ncbi:MAG: hypothetical protein V7751_13640 [Pseudoalteromonas distincta]